MKVKKRGDTYFVQIQRKGNRYNLTFEHDPTDMDIAMAIAEKDNAPKIASSIYYSLSFEECIKAYNELKKDRLSPSTLKDYKRMHKRYTKEFIKMKMGDITQLDVDKEVAVWLSRSLSWKTMHEYVSFINYVFTEFMDGKKFNEKMLPEKPKKEEPYIPTNNDVSRILKYFKENHNDLYGAYWLSAYGLRRGELMALRLSDIDRKTNTVNINKAYVDEGGKWVLKEPKTQASKRSIVISEELVNVLYEQGYVYGQYTNKLNRWLTDAQKKLNIPHFSLHKMRHYCCTELFDMGYTETDICAYMGWDEESEVMRQVYKHSRLKSDFEKKKEIADSLTKRFIG